MTVEELLKPRYKVIATYPDNKDFPIGKIIEFHEWSASKGYWEHSVEDCQGKREWLSGYFDDYPHIFKKLEWWEERDKKDMPEYVIQRDREDGGGNKLPDLVIKIKKHFSAGNGEWRDDLINIFASDIPLGQYLHSYSYSGFEPATKEEYEQSKQQTLRI